MPTMTGSPAKDVSLFQVAPWSVLRHRFLPPTSTVPEGATSRLKHQDSWVKTWVHVAPSSSLRQAPPPLPQAAWNTRFGSLGSTANP